MARRVCVSVLADTADSEVDAARFLRKDGRWNPGLGEDARARPWW